MTRSTISSEPAGASAPTLEVRLEALAGAIEALTGIGQSLTDASSGQLSKALGVLDRVAALAAAGRVAVTAQAQRSSAIGRRRTARTADWVREHAPSQRRGRAGLLARAAELVGQPDLAPIEAAMLSGTMSPGVALSVRKAYERVRDRLAGAESAPHVLDMLLEAAEGDGLRALNTAVTQLLETYGKPGAIQEDQDAASARVALSHGIQDADGTTRYDLVADAVGRAILEGAIGPLCAPMPSPDGSPDSRSAEHRRGQALFEVCRRVGQTAGFDRPARPLPASETTPSPEPNSPSPWRKPPAEAETPAQPTTATQPTRPTPTEPAAPMPSPMTHVPTGVKSILFVTMTLTDLVLRSGSAQSLGAAGYGTRIAPETARRLACDGGVIPVVLGSQGEILDLGRQSRLFSYAQTKALWLRDRHCTYPGCDVPPFWADSHHLRHWADGGASELSNAALLCGPHHDTVHHNRLAGTVRADGTGVDWNLTPGSYQPLRGAAHPYASTA